MRRLKQQIKRLIRTIAGKDFYPRIDHKCRTRRFGSDYGGWEVVAEHLDKDSVVYSFGVGEDASFDMAMIDCFGLVVHAFDPTPKSIQWVHRQGFPERFVMHEVGLADHDGSVIFSPPEDSRHVSHTLLDRPSTQEQAITVSVKCLETIMAELGHRRIDLLKMDIEGAEYQVVDGLVESNIRPTQLLIEYHHRFPDIGLSKTKESIKKLRGIGYDLFSVSSSGEEYGFVLKSARRHR